MRIIEPGNQVAYTNKKSRTAVRKLLVGFLVLFLASILYLKLNISTDDTRTEPQLSSPSQTPTSPSPLSEVATPKKIRTLTGAEIKIFLDSFSYPNVSEIEDLPSITGNLDADKRIRSIAETRGYRQKAIPNTSLVKIDGYAMQQKTIDSWNALKTAAVRDGIILKLNEGFRSIDDQRQLFVERYLASGGSGVATAAGQQDELVNRLLEVTAIPGFSKHHTGFTVDIACGNSGAVFEATPCFSWLSANNYANAKLAGWLPSYPDGAPAQGPNPEPWEYVWVGTDSLYE